MTTTTTTTTTTTPTLTARDEAKRAADDLAARLRTSVGKITTTLTAPGERAVKVDGQYVGLIFRDADGWHYAGRTARAFRTFTEAARYTAVYATSKAV